jgi:hypothetical protein
MTEIVVTGCSDRNIDGTFKRTHKQWSLNNFNDGWVDSKGRFRVYYPLHPRASKLGYILREIVAYEAYYNISVPLNMEIHHKDGNKVNDSKENLEMESHSEHKLIHSRLNGNRIKKKCEVCNKEFEIIMARIRDREYNRGRFCSQLCYHIYRRNK